MNSFSLFKKAFSALASWLLLMLAFIAPLTWLSIKQPECWQNFHHIISQETIFFIVFRWLLIVSIFIFWPRVIRLISHRHKWLYGKTLFWLSQRLRIVAWLALFEIVVCEHLFLQLIRIWESFI